MSVPLKFERQKKYNAFAKTRNACPHFYAPVNIANAIIMHAHYTNKLTDKTP